MGPLDDPPTANKGGCGPLFWINPPGERDGTAVRVRRRRELELFRDTAGQGASLLPVVVGSWFLGSAVPAKTWRDSWLLS